jgi:NADPH:quinone reductase-like Zn-dependent oxidoreductase
VEACGLNHLDLWVRQGLPGVSIPMPHVSGSDVVGIVVGKGPAVRGVRVGQRVVVAPGIACGDCPFCRSGWESRCPEFKILGLQTNGGYAEYTVVPGKNLIPVSDRLSPEEWACIPLVFLTAWHMLVTRGGLKRGESVLIHAAGSGIGSAAIQIAKLKGATVYATVGSEEKVKKAKALGADAVMLYRKVDFADEVLRLTKRRGVDLVFEHIGPDTWDRSVRCLARGGRLVTCGATSGPKVGLELRYCFTKELSVLGCYMGSCRELQEVMVWVNKGRLKPVLDSVFPLHEAAKAQAVMESRNFFGKLVLKVKA